MSELTDFLLARIAEDEAVAREVMRGERWSPMGLRYSEQWDATVALADSEVAVAHTEEPVADHIARHDPARVLAECEAKRLVISTLQAWDPDPVAPERVETAEHDAWRMLACLALPYADHPDYREEWRP